MGRQRYMFDSRWDMVSPNNGKGTKTAIRRAWFTRPSTRLCSQSHPASMFTNSCLVWRGSLIGRPTELAIAAPNLSLTTNLRPSQAPKSASPQLPPNHRGCKTCPWQHHPREARPHTDADLRGPSAALSRRLAKHLDSNQLPVYSDTKGHVTD